MPETAAEAAMVGREDQSKSSSRKRIWIVSWHYSNLASLNGTGDDLENTEWPVWEGAVVRAALLIPGITF